MLNELTEINLVDINHGVISEMLQDGLEQVIKNIKNPNTGLSEREVILKIKFKPSDDRRNVNVKIIPSLKLADPIREAVSHLYVGIDKGNPVAFENNPEQLELGMIVPIKQNGGDQK